MTIYEFCGKTVMILFIGLVILIAAGTIDYFAFDELYREPLSYIAKGVFVMIAIACLTIFGKGALDRVTQSR